MRLTGGRVAPGAGFDETRLTATAAPTTGCLLCGLAPWRESFRNPALTALGDLSGRLLACARAHRNLSAPVGLW